MKIAVSSPPEIKIRIESLSPGQEWSFRNTYAGVLGLADRVEQFHAFAPDGTDLNAKKIATGEFRSNAGAVTIEYVVKLPPPGAADVAHVSWIAGESGLLMLADLLPQFLPGVVVEFSLPSGWTAQSVYEADKDGKHHVLQPEETVFLIGRALRKQAKRFDGGAFDFVVDGSWPFKDAVVIKAATKVLAEYLALTGFPLQLKPLVMLAPLPVATGSVKWRAETRGATVVLLLDPQAQIANWPGQLGIIFTHELLHLWVPNSLLLEGDYDWFFEGFTLYTALVTALELKFINRAEYLATLGRVYDSYLSRADDLSLIDASERRWTTGNSTVYDKGMLVAFLYDLAIKRDSGGKMWLGSLYRKLFAQRAIQPANGNEVIIGLLSSTPAGADLAKSYIEGQRELDLKPLFADQKQLLKSLYYR
ncbi:MAG TPA: hypothetical protein VJP89_20255 [Pyrinomonadaceae bacterium]|nr:hypothetical protein [Pyrinomonadaceae bacterium]